MGHLRQTAFRKQDDAALLRCFPQHSKAVFAPEMIGLRVFLVNAEAYCRRNI